MWLYNAAEANKNICCAKYDGAVDHILVTRWLKKFLSDCKNLNDQTRSVRPKGIEDTRLVVALEVYQASSASHNSVWFVSFTTLAYPVSSIRRVSGELSISQSSVVRLLHDLGISSE